MERIDVANALRILTFLGVVASLLLVFIATTYQHGFRLPEETKKRVAVTPATTLSRFHIHFVAGFFHGNVAHIAFNLVVFSVGYWFATQRSNPLTTVGSSYAISMLSVFLLHLFLVLPLARLGVPYAVRALDLPLVGFSVIAYATFGAGVHEFSRVGQLVAVALVLLFEGAAGIWVTGPFVSVYHVVGFGLGFYIRWIARTPFAA